MIEWNRVTWYSKLGAIILFLGVIPALCFYIGTQYEVIAVTATPTYQEQTYQSSSNNNQTIWPGVVGVDSNTYNTISFYHSKDKNHVWFRDPHGNVCEMEGADPATFSEDPTVPFWGEDKNAVFNGCTLINNLDSKSFVFFDYSKVELDTEPLDYSAYAQDRNGVYFVTNTEVENIKGADINTFQPVSTSGKTANAIYFPPEATQYAKDANYVYWQNNILPGADPKTFRVVYDSGQYAFCASDSPDLGIGYGEDSNHTYCKDKVLQ